MAVLLGLLKEMKEENTIPVNNLKILISNYEEVGFGASYLPEDIEELLAIDMGAMGDDLNGSELKVSICAKDSSGPYDYEMTNRLIALAEEKEISYVVDVFPHYGSDVSAALRGGNNIRGALIGQGVNASHGMERTHVLCDRVFCQVIFKLHFFIPVTELENRLAMKHITYTKSI